MTRTNKRKFHYIYKTTCVISNRFYLGMHSTDDLNDGYLGSGKQLWFSIRKHGRENHTIEILEYLENRDLLKNREREIVTKELVNDRQCMNMKIGGEGGWGVDPEILKRPKTEETKKKMSESARTRVERNGKTSRTIETKEKIRKANIAEKNPHFGKCYIYSLDEKRSISIPKEELENWIALGWIKGRKIKFD